MFPGSPNYYRWCSPCIFCLDALHVPSWSCNIRVLSRRMGSVLGGRGCAPPEHVPFVFSQCRDSSSLQLPCRSRASFALVAYHGRLFEGLGGKMPPHVNGVRGAQNKMSNSCFPTTRLRNFYRGLNLLRLSFQMAVLVAYSGCIPAYG